MVHALVPIIACETINTDGIRRLMDEGQEMVEPGPAVKASVKWQYYS
jgi:hypothetical protein